MSLQTYTPTARCVHCTWSSDVSDEVALREQRDIHELMHPGGTVLVGDSGTVPESSRAATNGFQRGVKGQRKWTRGQILDEVRRWHLEKGSPPKSGDWQSSSRGDYPSYTAAMEYFYESGWRGLLAEAGVLTDAADPYGSLAASAAGRPRQGAGPPEAESKPVRRQAVDTNDADPAPSLVALAERVDTLSTRRRAMLAELDALEVELRDALGACQEALSACEIEAAA